MYIYIYICLHECIPRVSQLESTGGRHFGQNGKKLHENDKISVFWAKTVERGYKLNCEGR